MTTRRRPALRSFVLGWVCGGRTSFGPVALVLTASRPGPGERRIPPALAVLASAGECVVDKLPGTPSRLEPQVLGGRVVVGAGSAATLAHRAAEPIWVPVALGAAGAVAGSYAGAAWRRWAARRGPDWPAAVAEDALTGALAWWATRRLLSPP